MPKGSSKKKRRWPVWIAALALLAAAALALLEARPHTSQVPVEDGTGTIYITPIPGLPVSSFTAGDFTQSTSGTAYTGGAYTAYQGVDVS